MRESVLWRRWHGSACQEKENRTLADAIAKLREHLCLGPELQFDYTLSWFLRKAWARPGCDSVLAGRLQISPDDAFEVPSRGIARARVVLFRTLAGCRHEAA